MHLIKTVIQCMQEAPYQSDHLTRMKYIWNGALVEFWRLYMYAHSILLTMPVSEYHEVELIIINGCI
jgi:hypothetical protein